MTVVTYFLRPAHEIISAGAFFTAALLFVGAPHWFLLSSSMATMLGSLFFALGLWRFWQAMDVIIRRRQQKQLPIYAMTPDDLPVGKNGDLFIGRGFKWTSEHTQMLYDCRQNPELLTDGALVRGGQRVVAWLRRHHPTAQPAAHRLADMLEIFFPAAREGDPLLHGVGTEKEKEIWLPATTRKQGHSLIFGVPGAGKTRLLENFAAQDIRRGDGAVIVFDPKGDRDILLRMFYECKRAGRLSDFQIFHLGFPDFSSRYNPISSYSRITQIASRIAEQLPAGGDAAAFKNFVWLYVNSIAKAMEFLGEIPSYQVLSQYANEYEQLFNRVALTLLSEQDITAENWQNKFESKFGSFEKNNALHKTLAQRNRESAGLFKLLEWYGYTKNTVVVDMLTTLLKDASYHSKLIGSLSPMLSRVCTDPIGGILNPNYPDLSERRPIFTWREVVNSKKIVYVALDSLTDSEVATGVGMAMFADLTATIGEIYTENQSGVTTANPDFSARINPIYVHADEFNTTLGSAFVPLINQGRGAGVNLMCYTQTPEDIEARVDKSATAKQIVGNFRNLFMMRVESPSTKNIVEAKLPKVPLSQKEIRLNLTDKDDTDEFGASTSKSIKSQLVNIIEASDIGKLPVGEVFVIFGGGALHKIRLPLPVTTADMSNITLDDIKKHMLS